MTTFNNLDKDVLKEVGNIGTGHASVAMSLLTNQKTHISHTETHISTSTAILKKILHKENIPSVIHINIEGDLTGEAFLLLFEETGQNIIRILKTKKYKASVNDSILSEFGNIMIGSYLNALSNLINLIMKPTVPHLHTEETLSGLLKKTSKEKTITIRTDVFIKEERIQAALVLAFSKESLTRILNRTRLMTILIVDEKSTAAKRIKDIFSSFGNIKVYSADSHDEAIEIFQDHAPNICFIGESQGKALFSKLKKEKHKSQMILMSTKRVTKNKIRQIGAHDILKKPFKKDHVISFIDG